MAPSFKDFIQNITDYTAVIYYIMRKFKVKIQSSNEFGHGFLFVLKAVVVKRAWYVTADLMLGQGEIDIVDLFRVSTSVSLSVSFHDLSLDEEIRAYFKKDPSGFIKTLYHFVYHNFLFIIQLHSFQWTSYSEDSENTYLYYSNSLRIA